MLKNRIVIAGACRTPVGKFGQRLKTVSPQELLRVCFKDTIRRTGVNISDINSSIAGTCIHLPDSMNIARASLLLAGLSDEAVIKYRDNGVLSREVVRNSSTVDIPGFTVSRNCGSGIQAVISAVQSIESGRENVILVGGTESMSNSPGMVKRGAFSYNQKDAIIVDSLLRGLTDPLTGEMMGLIAEHVVEKFGISRVEQDEFAARSHQKAFKAIRLGKFKMQITPVLVREKGILGGIREEIVSEDEGPDPNISAAKLASLKPYFKKDGTITPGNSCMVNDGAASFLVMTLEKANELGIKPEAEIIEYGISALDPSYMGQGPTCSILDALKRTKLKIDDIDIFEINEAFAAVVLTTQQGLNIPANKINIYGGAIPLGHPVGATGAILTVKAVNILKDLQKELATISFCVGNGQGVALLIKNFTD